MFFTYLTTFLLFTNVFRDSVTSAAPLLEHSTHHKDPVVLKRSIKGKSADEVPYVIYADEYIGGETGPPPTSAIEGFNVLYVFPSLSYSTLKLTICFARQRPILFVDLWTSRQGVCRLSSRPTSHADSV